MVLRTNIVNGFGYTTGAFQNTALFGNVLITANADMEMFVARFQDMDVSGTYKNLENKKSDSNNSILSDFIKIYPNPANNKLNIDLSFPFETKIKITLCDLMGNNIRTIDEGYYNNKHLESNVFDLSNGIYLLKIELPNKTIINKIAVVK